MKREIQHLVLKIALLSPLVSQLNPDYTLTQYFLVIHFNINLSF
jgi:hypothetical protein